jgi:pimeloyl-ACP methyl ester carboxylesterase
MGSPILLRLLLVVSIVVAAGPALAAQTEAAWTGAADFTPPNETTPGYESMRLGGWGGDALDHTPRQAGIALDHVYVFVHGNSGDASLWEGYRTFFRDRGFNDSALWAVSWTGGFPRDWWWDQLTEGNSTDLTAFLEAVAVYTGTSKARIVGHSQGTSLTRDMLFEHRPANVTVTRFTNIAGPNGDKTSAIDAGAAVCLDPLYAGVVWCTQEFGPATGPRSWRDARVIADASLTDVLVIYSGTTSDYAFYRSVDQDTRYSPRDNVVAGAWPGNLTSSQHGDQTHMELLNLNAAEVFAFMTDPVCGDGQIAGAELCDGGDLGGQDCASLGFDCGTLACNGSCDGFDTSGCALEICGNDTIECSEACDGAQLDGQDCISRGYAGGVLACNVDCGGFDESGCTLAEVCGDGWCAGAAAGEDCASCPADCPGRLDGTPKRRYCCGNGTCESSYEDIVSCPIDCGGSPPVCGNGTIEGAEECDTPDLGGESCLSLGYDCGGVLACLPACTYDTSGCGASTCGDQAAECGEVCDGVDLKGQTCQSQGFDAGVLACSAGCQAFDTSSCTGGSSCGDGLCAGGAAGEDCTTCPADCPGQTGGKPSGRYCCGNGVCEPVGENNASCPADCP